jgi:hypothetical protein
LYVIFPRYKDNHVEVKIYYSWRRIDLFSLDIEGAEYDVLKTIPWDKVDVTALLVEVSDFYTSGKLNKWISRLDGGGLWFHFLTLKFYFFAFYFRMQF